MHQQFFHESLLKFSVVEECLHSFLPEKLREGAPTGFSMIGHIGRTTCTPWSISRTYPIKAHVNLNDEYLPYKHIIGQLIIDVGLIVSFGRIHIAGQKNKIVKTVVNKLNTINHQFRFFDMELIAGDPNYIVQHVSTRLSTSPDAHLLCSANLTVFSPLISVKFIGIHGCTLSTTA